jgi:hypothetical protein
VYRPNNEGEKWIHPVLGPGMQGHDRPLEFVNPVMKPWMKSEVIPLIDFEISGKGGSPYQPYEGDGMPPAFPRPKPSRMAGEAGGIVQLIASLLPDQQPVPPWMKDAPSITNPKPAPPGGVKYYPGLGMAPFVKKV